MNLNLEPIDDNHAISKPLVDSLFENDRNRFDLSLAIKDQDKEIDNNKLTKSHSVTFNRSPITDIELWNRKQVDV